MGGENDIYLVELSKKIYFYFENIGFYRGCKLKFTLKVKVAKSKTIDFVKKLFMTILFTLRIFGQIFDWEKETDEMFFIFPFGSYA